MEAFKATATLNERGHLILDQPLPLSNGQTVEIVIWPLPTPTKLKKPPQRTVQCDIPILKEWLENTQSPPPIDRGSAKQDYLLNKYLNPHN